MHKLIQQTLTTFLLLEIREKNLERIASNKHILDSNSTENTINLQVKKAWTSSLHHFVHIVNTASFHCNISFNLIEKTYKRMALEVGKLTCNQL